jgi:hypothetical protein
MKQKMSKRVLMAFTHTKKVYIESFIKATVWIRSQMSGSALRGLDPTRSGSGTLVIGH